MLLSNAIDQVVRRELLVTTLISAAGAGLVFFFATALLLRRAQQSIDSEAVSGVVRRLWPFTFVGVAPYILSTAAWSASPLFLYGTTCVVAGAACIIVSPPRALTSAIARAIERRPAAVVAALVIMIGAYSVYVSYHTIVNHHSLGTRAYDLGIMENVFWNSPQGDLFASSIEAEGNHLGVHTSFVYLLFFPLYALFPQTETLLILQTVFLALAAWPLFLLARSALHSGLQALTVSAIYLAHPAIGGANFYDFHELAFAPFILLFAFFFVRIGKLWAFWASIALLISVKEDMAILVALIGVVIVLSGKRVLGLGTIAVGALSFLFLQYVVISSFAGGNHNFGWYYTDMIPSGEGPVALVTSLIINPLFAVKFALAPSKVLYLFLLLSPLAFLTFCSLRGTVLVSYGLLASLLASREPLFQVGFQYALTTVACAFGGMLFWLESSPPLRRTRGITFAVILSLVTCYHYGMIYPRRNFSGGFQRIDFRFTEEEQKRYREVRGFVEEIPEDASVTASEVLVPHVARRRQVETARYAAGRPGRSYDYYFLLLRDAQAELELLPEVASLQRYEVVRKGTYCVLLRRSK